MMRRLWTGVVAGLRFRARANVAGWLIAVAATATSMATLLSIVCLPGAEADRERTADARIPVLAKHATGGVEVPPPSDDEFHGDELRVVRVVGATGSRDEPVPPGIPRLPASGEAFVSPDLARLIAEHRRNHVDPQILLDRVPGTIRGYVERSGLQTPTELVAYVGVDAIHYPGKRYEALATQLVGWGSSSEANESDDANRYVVWIGALACGVPIIALAIAGGRMSARHRARRLSALRLVGYSTTDLRVVTAVELAIKAVVGVLVGVVLQAMGNRLLHDRGWLPASWWIDQLSPSPPQVVACGAALSMVSLAAGLVASRTSVRQGVVTRPETYAVPRRVRAWHVLPLLCTTVAVITIGGRAREEWLIAALILAVALTIPFAIGPLVVLAGKWTADRSRGLTTLWAGRRTAHGARTLSRLIAGIAATTFVGGIGLTLWYDYDATTYGEEQRIQGSWPDDTVLVNFAPLQGDAEAVRAVPGVRDVIAIDTVQGVVPHGGLVTVGLIDCSDLAGFALRSEFANCQGGQGLYSPDDVGSTAPYEAVRALTDGRSKLRLDRRHTVALPANGLATSDRIGAMLSETGYDLLLNIDAVSHAARKQSMPGEIYFRPANSDAIERVRTLIASRYDIGVVEVQTLDQRVAEQRADSIRYSRALWAAIVFGAVVALIALAAATADDAAQQRGTLRALLALGFRRSTVVVAPMLSMLLSLAASALCVATVGLFASRAFIAASQSHAEVPIETLLIAVVGVHVAALAIGSIGIVLARPRSAAPVREL